MAEDTEYLTSSEVARLLLVSPKTINRWADRGLIGCIVTLGQHRRFPRSEVDRVAARMRATEPSAAGPERS